MDDNEGVNFIDDMPRGGDRVAKDAVDEAHGAPCGRRPTAGKDTRVVKQDDAAGHNERTPILPIAGNTLVRMVAVDDEKIDSFAPELERFVTELANPLDAPVARLPDGGMGRMLPWVEQREAAEMKRVDKEEATIRMHHFARSQRGGAFRDADFDQRTAAASPFLNGFVFLASVLRENGTHSHEREYGVPQDAPGRAA